MVRIYNKTVEGIEMKLGSNIVGLAVMLLIVIMGMLYKEI